jgi:hypothetical protein
MGQKALEVVILAGFCLGHNLVRMGVWGEDAPTGFSGWERGPQGFTLDRRDKLGSLRHVHRSTICLRQ